MVFSQPDGLRQLCRKYSIPIPQNGYWQKIKAHKPVILVRLPASYKGEDTMELPLRNQENSVPSTLSLQINRAKEITSDPKAPLIVPESLVKPHLLISQTKQYWSMKEDARRKEGAKMEILSIRVEKPNQKRALLFMNALIKLLEYRGHTVQKGKYWGTDTLVMGVEIPIDLREATRRIPGKDIYNSSEYIPTGELILKIGKYSGEKEFRDGGAKIETMLAKIVAKLEIIAEREIRWEEQSRIAQQKREAEQKVKDEIIQRKQKEIKDFNGLVSDAERYHKAQIIRTYIAAVAANESEEERSDETRHWIEWAKKKANWYDPILKIPDDILDSEMPLI